MRRAAPSGSISVRQHPRPAPFRSASVRSLVRRALGALRAAGLQGPGAADIRILVVGDEEMARWNGEFLGRPRTTNVISFPEEETPDSPPARMAGDILVSAPTGLRQTRGWPGTPEERIFYFILHGMLHLLGFDHEKGPAAARRMRSLERDVYGSVVPAAAARGGRRRD